MNGVPSGELERYADLVLSTGVNVGDGQPLLIAGCAQHADLMAAIAERAYAHGASRAETYFFDDRVRAAQAGQAPSDALAAQVAPWYEQMYRTVVDERWARIRTLGDPFDDPYRGVPAHRASALDTALFEPVLATIEAGLNWCVCPCPTAGWARRVYGEPDIARLWRDLWHVLRLDEADPAAAWEARRAELTKRAAKLDSSSFAALHFKGGGTDLVVPLHADAVWQPAWLTTPWGQTYLCNLPSEEVYTAPDFRGVHGIAVVTRPVTINGTTVEGLVLRFERGRIVAVEADVGADTVRAHVREDAGASRLGEVALVDGSSRIGRLGTVFNEVLLDENAACHIAWGAATNDSFPGGLPAGEAALEARGVNHSKVHQDVMIGGPQVDVLGVTVGDEELPVLTGERWQI